MKSQPSTDPPKPFPRSNPKASRAHHTAPAPAEHESGHGPPKKTETSLQIAYLSLKVVEAMAAIIHGLIK